MNDSIQLQLSNVHAILWHIQLQQNECSIDELLDLQIAKDIIDNYYNSITGIGDTVYSKKDFLADIYDLFVKSAPTKAIAESYELENWLESSKRAIKEDRFNIYKSYLIRQGKGNSIEQLESETFKILDSCHNPRVLNRLWDRRGLVYGNVQSGKTSNFIGLINRAFDHGYRIVIVFTGVTEDLRKQTQLRVNSGVLGIRVGEDSGVGASPKFRELERIISPTSIENDLSNSDYWLRHNVSPRSKSIWVIKKNPRILEVLIEWLNYHKTLENTDKIFEAPFLIIDDEADNASIQSMSTRDFNLWELGQEIAGLDLDNLSPEQETTLNKAKESVIKTINRNIRVILSLIGNKTFVGYTATPYSIINQRIEDIERTVNINDVIYNIDENSELFPEHFIIPIKPGPSYIGIDKIYNSNEDKRLPVLINISNNPFQEDIERVFPSQRGVNYTFNTIPNSLIDAIYSFLVVIIVRKKRGHHDFNTMLIHTSHLTRNADYVYVKVDEFITTLYNNLHILDRNEEINHINRILNNFKLNSNNEIFKQYFGEAEIVYPESISKIDIINIINPENDSPLKIVSYHSTENQENATFNRNLSYDHRIIDGERRFCNYIVIGGNRLSRGLTLEGLSVSYFVRSSTRQDSLYQMARWFGYRPGYEDLIKIFMPNDQIHWFESVFKLEENLRKDFEENNSDDSKIMPRDAIIKMAYHTPDNLYLGAKLIKKFPSICDPNKLKHTKKQALSFSGTTKSKKIINDREIQAHNLRAVQKFMISISQSDAVLFNNAHIPKIISNNNINYTGVNYRLIIDFLRNQQLHDHIKDDIAALIDFISKNSNELSNWSVVLAQKPNSATDLGELSWNMDYFDRKNNLISQKITGLVRSPSEEISEDTMIFSRFLDKDVDNTFDIIDNTNIDDYVNEIDSNKSNKRYLYRNQAKKPLLIIYPVSGIVQVDYCFPLFYITIPHIAGGKKVTYIIRNK